jgi:hypothetical protein
VSRSPNNLLAIGIGTRDVAVGLCQSRVERLWALLQQRSLKALSLEDFTAPLAIAARCNVAIPSGQCYAEAGALDTLRMALMEAVTQFAPAVARRKRMAAIVLDDFWVNHGVLRGDFRSMRKRDVEEVARAYFADAFGLESSSLATAIAVQSGGDAVFASAMPRSLLAGIQQICAEADIGVKCLVPRLPRLLDRARCDIPDGEGMLVWVTDDLLQVVLTDRRHWLAYDAQRSFSRDRANDAQLAEHASTMFERWSDEASDTCTVYLGGNVVDASAFEQCFASVHRLQVASAAYPSPAFGLMELAS